MIRVKLTLAQERFLREVIEVGETLGDCRLRGLTLEFDDYEGAQAVRNRMLAMHLETTRAYISWDSVVTKIDKAIEAWTRRAA